MAEITDQKGLDVLFQKAMGGDKTAVKQLKKLILEGKAHVPAGGQAPVLGAAPVAEAAVAAETPKPAGPAAKKELTEAQLKEIADSEARARAAKAEQAAAEKAELEKLLKEREAAAATKTAVEEPKVEEAPKKTAPKGEAAKKKAPDAPVKTAEKPAVTDTGFVRQPEAPAAPAAEGPKLLGEDGAKQFRDASSKLGVDGDNILKRKGTKAKRLQDIPDTAENRKAMREWLAAEANKPAAKARLRMNAAAAAAGPGEGMALPRPESKKQGRRGGRTPAVLESGERIDTPLTVDEVKRRNFGRLDQRMVMRRANEFLGGKGEITDVDKRKIGELLVARDELMRVPELRSAAVAELGLGELNDKLANVEKALTGAGDPTPMVQNLANSYDKYMYGGKVRGSLLATTVEKAVRPPWSVEQRAKLGKTLGEVYAKDERGFDVRKRKTVKAIKEVAEIKNNRDLKQLLIENDLISSDTPATNQRGLIAAIPESKVEDLKKYVATRREEIAAGGKDVLHGDKKVKKAAVGKGGAAPTLETAADAAEPTLATAADEATPTLDTAEVPAAPKARAGAAEAAAGAADIAMEAGAVGGATAASAGGPKVSAKEASKLRGSLARISPDAEAGLIKAARAKGLNVASIDDLPKSEMAWARKWAAGSGASRRPVGVSKLPDADMSGRVMGPTEDLSGRVIGPGELKEAGPRQNFRTQKLPRTAGRLAELEARAAKMGLGGARMGAMGRIGMQGLRFLGPLAAIYGAYQIASALKGQTVDEADERRLRVMQALGAVGGGMGQEMQQREQIRAMSRMVDLAAIQRQQQRDELNKQYTGNMALDALLRGQEATLSTLAQPSRPSVAEMMMRM